MEVTDECQRQPNTRPTVLGDETGCLGWVHEGLGRSRRRSKGFYTKMRAEWGLRSEIDGKGFGRIDDTAGEDGAM